jgi:predicted dehydrogenase
MACLQHGKHVLLEKPITKNIDQAKELFDIALQKNLTLHAGHVERFNGAVQELKKIIHEPYLIESHRIGPFTSRAVNETVVLDLMIHDLDIISSLVKSPVKKFDVVDRTVKSSLSDIATVHIEFENGTLANIVSSRISHVKKRMMAIHQKNAFFQLDFTTQDIFIHRHTSTSVKVGHNQLRYKQEGTVERLFVYKENPLKQEIEYFLKSIETGKNRTFAKQDLDALKLTLEIEKALGYKHDSSHCRDRLSSSACV